MKGVLKYEKHIFDNLKRTAAFENIDESTVIEKTGASTERIISGVFEQLEINGGKKMKKRYTKRIVVCLAAAVLLVATFSLMVVADSIHSVFSIRFSADIPKQ